VNLQHCSLQSLASCQQLIRAQNTGAKFSKLRSTYTVLCYPDISIFDEDNDIAVIALNNNSMQKKWETIYHAFITSTVSDQFRVGSFPH